MEPFRSVVDFTVAELVRELGYTPPLDRNTKQALIDALLGTCQAEGQTRTLFDAAALAVGTENPNRLIGRTRRGAWRVSSIGQ